MREIQNHHEANYSKSCRQDPVMVLKSVGDCLRKNKASAQSRQIFPKIFINYKERNNNFMVDNPGRHHLHQVIGLTSSELRHTNIVCPIGHTEKDATSLLWYSCQNKHNLNHIMRKYQIKLNRGTFYKITDHYSSNVSKP